MLHLLVESTLNLPYIKLRKRYVYFSIFAIKYRFTKLVKAIVITRKLSTKEIDTILKNFGNDTIIYRKNTLPDFFQKKYNHAARSDQSAFLHLDWLDRQGDNHATQV